MARNKKHYDDDGRQIVDMNVDGMPNYISEEQRQKITEIRQLNLTKKEKRAIFWGSFLALIPVLATILVGFGTSVLFIWWWLVRGL